MKGGNAIVNKDNVRVAVTLSREMVKLIDDVCKAANQNGDREPLTRSRFIALCVLYFAAPQQAKEINAENPN